MSDRFHFRCPCGETMTILKPFGSWSRDDVWVHWCEENRDGYVAERFDTMEEMKERYPDV